MNQPQPLLAVVWSPWRATVSDNHAWTREPLWKLRFPAEKLQHTIGVKKKKKDLKNELYALERVRGTV